MTPEQAIREALSSFEEIEFYSRGGYPNECFSIDAAHFDYKLLDGKLAIRLLDVYEFRTPDEAGPTLTCALNEGRKILAFVNEHSDYDSEENE